MVLPEDFDLASFVRATLAEDLGSGGDVTSRATIGEGTRLTASMACREPVVVAGIAIAQAFFVELDAGVAIDSRARDGDAVQAGAVLMTIDGDARAMLTAERSA